MEWLHFILCESVDWIHLVLCESVGWIHTLCESVDFINHFVFGVWTGFILFVKV